MERIEPVLGSRYGETGTNWERRGSLENFLSCSIHLQFSLWVPFLSCYHTFWIYKKNSKLLNGKKNYLLPLLWWLPFPFLKLNLRFSSLLHNGRQTDRQTFRESETYIRAQSCSSGITSSYLLPAGKACLVTRQTTRPARLQRIQCFKPNWWRAYYDRWMYHGLKGNSPS